MSDLLREAAGDGAARSDTRATTPEHDGTFSYGFVRTQGTPPEHGEEQAAAAAAAAAAARQGVKGTSRKWTSTEDDLLVAWHAAHPNDWVGASRFRLASHRRAIYYDGQIRSTQCPDFFYQYKLA